MTVWPERQSEGNPVAVTPVDEGKRMGISSVTYRGDVPLCAQCADAYDDRFAIALQAAQDTLRLNELERLWEEGFLLVRLEGYDTLREAADLSLTPPSVSPVSSGEAKE